MTLERGGNRASLVDVFDRVLDKGIVIDAWVSISLAGIDLITVEARVVVASIQTYLKHADAVAQLAPAASASWGGITGFTNRLIGVPGRSRVPEY
jgi:hypothetical protein